MQVGVTTIFSGNGLDEFAVTPPTLIHVSYYRNSHERDHLIQLFLGTNGHRSVALGRLPFILPPVFVQAAVIRCW